MDHSIVIDFEALHKISLLTQFRTADDVSVDHRDYGPILENASAVIYQSPLTLAMHNDQQVQSAKTSTRVDTVDQTPPVPKQLDSTTNNVPPVSSPSPVAPAPASTVSELPIPPVPVTSSSIEQEITQAMIQLFDEPAYWLGDLFVVDLNQDGVDELIVAGRKSQPSSATAWHF